jgi:hypothetical protein
MKIPVKVYEEIKREHLDKWGARSIWIVFPKKWDVEWVDVNGINTPYMVTVVNKDA